jgi:hypothetical protein
MPLDFVNTDDVLEPQRVRFDADAHNVIIAYMKANDLKNFNTALNSILRRIGRVGIKHFYEATALDSSIPAQTNTNYGEKSPVIGVNHGSISISDEK